MANVPPLFYFLQEIYILNELITTEVVVANDFTVTGKVDEIMSYWDMPQKVGSPYGYFPKPSKTYLIV